MICYDAVFFSQGVVDMCYWRKMLRARSAVGDTFFAPVTVVLAILLYSLHLL